MHDLLCNGCIILGRGACYTMSHPVRCYDYLYPAGVVQGRHPPSGPRGHQLGGSWGAQGGGSVIGRPRRPAVGFTLGWEPAGPYWPQPGQPDWSAFIVVYFMFVGFLSRYDLCISSARLLEIVSLLLVTRPILTYKDYQQQYLFTIFKGYTSFEQRVPLKLALALYGQYILQNTTWTTTIMATACSDEVWTLRCVSKRTTFSSFIRHIVDRGGITSKGGWNASRGCWSQRGLGGH